ncbi:hypothetical protein BDW67DRAFT_167522 [Aspergillus spinulosporus]
MLSHCLAVISGVVDGVGWGIYARRISAVLASPAHSPLINHIVSEDARLSMGDCRDLLASHIRIPLWLRFLKG